jgi:hypothetical protein
MATEVHCNNCGSPLNVVHRFHKLVNSEEHILYAVPCRCIIREKTLCIPCNGTGVVRRKHYPSGTIVTNCGCCHKNSNY